MTPLRAACVSGALALTVGLLSACGDDAGTDATTAGGEVTISNCGTDASFPSPAERMYVGGDGNLLSMVLSLGAQDQVAGVSGLSDTKEALSTAYGTDVVDALPVATKDYPTMENVIAQKPDVMLAGWNYGYSEEKNLTPDLLEQRGIAAGGHIVDDGAGGALDVGHHLGRVRDAEGAGGLPHQGAALAFVLRLAGRDGIRPACWLLLGCRPGHPCLPASRHLPGPAPRRGRFRDSRRRGL